MTHTTSAISLDDKFKVRQGKALITGTQALVRLPMLQRELDKKAGLKSAGFITGYRGSPLGGLDAALWKAEELLKSHDIVFQPGVNEDLAITAVWGTQLLECFDDATVDGIFSYWYGKGPGVDRSGDAIKHGNYNGTNKNGGVLIVYGDDHSGKSSTVAHQSEQALAANSVPSLYPASVGEIIEFGLLGWAASRYSGLWVGLKTVNETVEQTSTVEMDMEAFEITRPAHESYPSGSINVESNEIVFPTVKQEVRVNRIRLPLLHHFVRANAIDKVAIESDKRKLGIVTAGKAYMDVIQALQLLGIDTDRAQALGISVFKVGMIWPLEPEGLKAFAKGQEELFFVEEKKAFMEDQAKAILFDERERPAIYGKTGPHGEAMLPSDVQLEPFLIARELVRRMVAMGISDDQVDTAIVNLRSAAEPRNPVVTRSPYFCSGCPHNTSTRVPAGSVAVGGIGCHGMASVSRSDTLSPAHMGGEGAQWSGLFGFTGTRHIFQNMGDGTYYHSGLLCIRNSIASKSNITYKILFNDAVAMTGGQPLDGPLSVYDVCNQVRAEGVQDIAVVSDDPGKFSRKKLPRGVKIYNRDKLGGVQEQFREIPGTTIIVYEQTCAAEKRRRRKVGKEVDPSKRMFINDEVCEGCGDCSVQSTCVSIQPIDTEKGRKRSIDQSSCNKDYSCNSGFCPSFVTVVGGRLRKPPADTLCEDSFADLPEPGVAKFSRSYNILVTGIGGSGVITVSAILGMAAHIDGNVCSIFDMTGLSQKNGAVFSHLKIAEESEQLGAPKLGRGDASLLMAFDLVAAVADDAFRTLVPGTKVVGNSDVSPTAAFQFDRDAITQDAGLIDELSQATGEDNQHFLEAGRIALKLLGNSIATNMFMVGYALQAGLLPVSRQALQRAIQLNGTAVEFNLRALKLGRLYAYRPEYLEQYSGNSQSIGNGPTTLESAKRGAIEFLTSYQNANTGRRFIRLVEQVEKAEKSVDPSSEKLALTTAVTMARLMAYKDEYEVARLHSSPEFLEKLAAQFEGNFKLRFNLAPPLISRKDPTNGLPRKAEYGSWMMYMFRILAKLKVLRGTWLDIFGYTAERKKERELIVRFENLMLQVCDQLNEDNFERALELAAMPGEIRGFGHVKNAKRLEVEQRTAEALELFLRQDKVVRLFDTTQLG